MTTQEQAASRLAGKPVEGEQRVASLWGDAFRRLARNRAAILGLFVIVAIVLVAVFAEQVAPFGYRDGTSTEARTVPLWLARAMPGNMEDYAKIDTKFLLGSDYLGRDLLSRVIYGARVSLPVGFMGALTALIIGLVYGCISATMAARWITSPFASLDIMYAFPTMLLIILLMAFFRRPLAGRQSRARRRTFNQINRVVDGLLGLSGGGMLFIFMGIGITAWMGTARWQGRIIAQGKSSSGLPVIGARDMHIIVRPSCQHH